MTPEQKARISIDKKLEQSGWMVQDVKRLNPMASLGVAVREFPTDTGPVDYALFVNGIPVGVIEAKKSDAGENITAVEEQSARYANSTFKWVKAEYSIRFAYEATDKLIRFTDYKDIKFRSRTVFSFHRPETLEALLASPDTIRNNMKHFPSLDETGFRRCQINAIRNLDNSFANNRPKALVQMATGAGKTFTAITAAYRLLKYGKMNRILFLVDTKSLGEQAEREFLAYTPNDDPRPFFQLYGVCRLKSSYIPSDVQICISTIQRMYSILKGEDLDESAEETPFAEYVTADSKAPKEVVYNEKYPPEFFDCIIVDAYGIIGLNSKGSANKGFLKLSPILFSPQMRLMIDLRRKYAQNEDLSAKRSAACNSGSTVSDVVPSRLLQRQSAEHTPDVDLHRSTVRYEGVSLACAA